MFLALAVLLCAVPQEHSAAVSADHDKISAVEISAAAIARPVLSTRELAATARDRSSAHSSLEPPEIPFSTDVPSLALVKRYEPKPPVASLPEHLDLRLPESLAPGSMAPGAPPRLVLRPSGETPVNRRLWYSLMASSHAAATFDAWSTRRAVSSGQAHEMDPMLRPFAHSNSLYVAVQASPALMDFLGRRMMTSKNPWTRKMWWIPQAAGTATSLLSGVHNVRVVH